MMKEDISIETPTVMITLYRVRVPHCDFSNHVNYFLGEGGNKNQFVM